MGGPKGSGADCGARLQGMTLFGGVVVVVVAPGPRKVMLWEPCLVLHISFDKWLIVYLIVCIGRGACMGNRDLVAQVLSWRGILCLFSRKMKAFNVTWMALPVSYDLCCSHEAPLFMYSLGHCGMMVSLCSPQDGCEPSSRCGRGLPGSEAG